MGGLRVPYLFMTNWVHRWKNWSDEQIEETIMSKDPRFQNYRMAMYAQTILSHVQPETTLDIGGGPGQLGDLLPGEYTVMDHPRIQKFTEATFLPVGSEIGYYDLVVNTNCWGETALPLVTSYIEQIEAAGCKWLYTSNRIIRQVSFHEYALDNWETVVKREHGRKFIEYLGHRK